MKPLTPPIRRAMPEAPGATAEQPFDELKLTAATLDRKVAKLRREGYFTIPVSPTTRQFLRKHEASDAKSEPIGKIADFRHSDYERSVTATATRVVAKLSGKAMKLTPQEFQIRWPKGAGADQWHQDKAKKVLTCITTLAGSGTEFVSPRVAEEKFTMVQAFPPMDGPRDGPDSIIDDIERTKDDRFYFFAARGLTAEEVPKLMHRAPGEADRSIFLARWLQEAPSDAAPSAGASEAAKYPAFTTPETAFPVPSPAPIEPVFYPAVRDT